VRNALYIWPAIHDLIRGYARGEKLAILDFGCGTGGLSQLLARDGHKVTGIDPSAAMINKAREDSSQLGIDFLIGDYKALNGRGGFDLIVASMVFQFIFSINETFLGLSKLQEAQRSLITVMHAPDYVRASIKAGKEVFTGFAKGVPGPGFVNINDTNVPIAIRDTKGYEKEALPCYELAEHIYPTYSKAYLARFPDELTTVSRCEILIWRRN